MYQGNTTVISQYLDAPDEEILWAGQPPRGIMYRPYDLFLIPFGMVWLLVAFSLQVKGISAAGGASGLIWAAPLTLIGLYLVAGRFIVDAKRRSCTFYGITNKRVLAISGVFRQSAKSVDLRALGNISVTDKGNGWGTVVFGGGLVFEEIPRLHDLSASLQRAQRSPAAI